MKVSDVIEVLRDFAKPEKVKGMERFGIPTENVLGVGMPQLRQVAREIGKDQKLADELWRLRIHEAKLLATIVAEPDRFPIEKADLWMKELYSWDTCDQFCMNLLVKTNYVMKLPARWVKEEGEFQKRASMAIIAVIAVHRKELSNQQMLEFKPLLLEAADDSRNFVKKAVNWAIRQIGKRNEDLRLEMLDFCEELLLLDQKASNWIARDAIRELKGKRTGF